MDPRERNFSRINWKRHGMLEIKRGIYYKSTGPVESKHVTKILASFEKVLSEEPPLVLLDGK